MVINEIWIYGFVSILMGLLWYFIRNNFEALQHNFKLIQKSLDEISQRHIDCRESLPNRFADKQETKEALERIAGQLCNHDHRIISIEHKISGREAN